MKENTGCAYEKPWDGLFYSPFNYKIDNMERLLLINFEKDPDEIYVGFEPQYFDDPVSGRGLRVIGWRKDGFVDVYQQPGLSMKNKDFNVAGNGLADLVQRDMDDARFTITGKGVDVHFAFEDKTGRHIEVTVSEDGSKPARPFDLLAPVGSSSKAPSSLPVILLYDFYFVRRKNTRVEINIGGRLHKPDSFPMPMDGSSIYFMRYSNDAFIAGWNLAYDGVLAGLTVEDGKAADSQGTVYVVAENEGHPELKQMKGSNGRHEICASFTPPLPDIACIKDGINLEGKFTISSDESAGVIEGEYKVSRNGSEGEIKIKPSGGWVPNESKWMVRFIYRMASIFKTWPKSYEWTGAIRYNDGPAPVMCSCWERK